MSESIGRARRRWSFAPLGHSVRLGIEMLPAVAQHTFRPLVATPRRVREQARLRRSNGITPQEYYFYGLERRDVSWARKQEFLGAESLGKVRQALGAHGDHGLEHEIATRHRLARAGVPLPRLMGVVGPEGRAVNGVPLRDAAEVRTWLLEGGIENVVFKPRPGEPGQGILILGKRIDASLAWQRMPVARIDVDALLEHLAGDRARRSFLVEERLAPHPRLEGFARQVLHSARIVTLLDDDVHVLAASLRIGMGVEPVDQFSAGNLVACIDAVTGRLGRAAARRWGIAARWSKHPVTQAPIEGMTLPDWHRALDIVRAAAPVLSHQPLLAWDLGFAASGPVVLGVQDAWNPDVTQFAGDRGLLATPLRAYLQRLGLHPW